MVQRTCPSNSLRLLLIVSYCTLTYCTIGSRNNVKYSFASVHRYSDVPSSCPQPEKPLHGFVTVRGDIAEYECQLNYHMLGSSVRTCSSKTSWSDIAPLCATDIAAGMASYISSNVNGSDPTFATDIVLEDPKIQNYAPIQNDGTCAQTEWEAAPWLIVDLIKPCFIDGYNISKLGYIDVQNRRNESQSLEILIGNNTSDMTLNVVCAQYDNIPSESGLYLSGFCVNGAVGRYVVVRAVSNNPSYTVKLGLCKVVVLSASALSSSHCPSPERHRLFGTKCYDFRSSEEMPWSQADQYCREHDGRLLVVDSDLEHDFVSWESGKSSFRRDANSQADSYWIGLKLVDKQWTTSDGTAVGFVAFSSDEQSSMTGVANACASIDSQQSTTWEVKSCDDFAGWICEYNISFCGSPFTPEGVGGYIPTKKFYPIGEQVTLLCAGNRKRNEIRITCLFGGIWTQPDKTCDDDVGFVTKVECSPLKEVPNSMLSKVAADHFEYKCKDGYILVGNSTLTCSSDGSWSSDQPTCRQAALREPTIVCPKPEGMDNGSFLLSQDPPVVGSKVIYSCNSGFLLKGSSSLTCASTGQWTTTVPHCQQETASSCADLTVVNADVIYLDQGNMPNQRAVVQCKSGYILRGESLLWCLSNGKWNATIPHCDLLAPFILNGVPNKDAGETLAESKNNKTGSITESTWAILVIGLVGAALFLAVVGFGAAFFITKWRKNTKPENPVITYQIGQQLAIEDYAEQMMLGTPPRSPQVPIVYAVNSGGRIHAQANLHFASGISSYHMEPIGSFTCHTSSTHSNISSEKKTALESGSVSVSSASRRGSVESTKEDASDKISVKEEDTQVAATSAETGVAKIQNTFIDNTIREQHRQSSNTENTINNYQTDNRSDNSNDSDNANENARSTNFSSKSEAETTSVLTVNDERPASPVLTRNAYQSEKVSNSFSRINEIVTSSPKFSVHISASTKVADMQSHLITDKQTVVDQEHVSDSRRNSSSSSYLGGSSDSSSGLEQNENVPMQQTNDHPPLPPPTPLNGADKLQSTLKRKTSWSVKDLQEEIRNLPLFQKIRNSLLEADSTDNKIPVQQTFQPYQRSSNNQHSHSHQSSYDITSQHLPTRTDFGQHDTSTPLAMLDEQFADERNFYEETSSDDIMYDKIDRLESPQQHVHEPYHMPDPGHLSDESPELEVLDQRIEPSFGQYYGPSAQLCDTSSSASEEANSADNVIEESSETEALPVSNHTRLRRLYTHGNQASANYADQSYPDTENALTVPNSYESMQNNSRRSPPVMGVRGLRRIPIAHLSQPTSGTRSEGEIEVKPRVRFSERFSPTLEHQMSSSQNNRSHRGPPVHSNPVPKKYPNSPRMNRVRQDPISHARSRSSDHRYTDSEEDFAFRAQLSSTPGRGQRSGAFQDKMPMGRLEVAKAKPQQQSRRNFDDFQAYLPNDEMLLSENFALDENFVEPVELRQGGHRRSQSGYRGQMTQRTRPHQSASSQRATPMDPKSNSTKSKSYSTSSMPVSTTSKDSDHKRKPTLVVANTGKYSRGLSDVSSTNGASATSVSWDAKKFKHRNKRVQFKDEIDQVVSHSPEALSDDEGRVRSQGSYWRQGLRATSPGHHRYGVNILSD